jgi:hypothetical protein
MKLHTKLDIGEVYNSLIVTKARDLMTDDIYFYQFIEQPSRTHPHGYLIQLGTYDQRSGPTNSRRYKNTGKRGSHAERNTGEPLWAATYEEWGWFIADLFERDPGARFGHYTSAAKFHEMTKNKFHLENIPANGVWVNTIHP